MNLLPHPANSRGFADHGWLKSYHSFSFANYFDPSKMGFKSLRVINDDYIDPSQGFGTHPHKDMEIITIPLHGRLRHKDTMGNETVIKHGEVQLMSAGTGILHSEYNDSDSEEVNMLQIWVLPKHKGIAPRYDQKVFDSSYRQNKLQLVVSPDGRESSVKINQDAYFYLGDFEKGYDFSYKLNVSSHGIYFFLIEGEVEINGESLSSRDAMGVDQFEDLEIQIKKESKILIMEVPEA